MIQKQPTWSDVLYRPEAETDATFDLPGEKFKALSDMKKRAIAEESTPGGPTESKYCQVWSTEAMFPL